MRDQPTTTAVQSDWFWFWFNFRFNFNITFRGLSDVDNYVHVGFVIVIIIVIVTLATRGAMVSRYVPGWYGRVGLRSGRCLRFTFIVRR